MSKLHRDDHGLDEPDTRKGELRKPDDRSDQPGQGVDPMPPDDRRDREGEPREAPPRP